MSAEPPQQSPETLIGLKAEFSDIELRHIYPELRRLARRERRRAGLPQDLQTTSLIHEAWLKLAPHRAWADKAHFMRTAARAMRFALIDAARARLRHKRLAQNPVVDGDRIAGTAPFADEDLVVIASALAQLAQIDARLCEVVDCRFFAGYTERETAQALAIDERTVRRDWVKAKAWLQRALSASAAC